MCLWTHTQNFLEISQNSQENTCARASEASVCNFIKKEAMTQAFSCEFCEISRTPFLQNTSRPLQISNSSIYFYWTFYRFNLVSFIQKILTSKNCRKAGRSPHTFPCQLLLFYDLRKTFFIFYY